MILDTLQTVGVFVLTLGILVSIHEYGHFWVARRCGVKVLRFSIGFGKSLWRWHDKQGTEFVIAAIPLGGYVKMLDEREGPVAESESHLSFNRQPVLARIAIVAAGPAANFLLAIFSLWLMYVVGLRTVIPQVGSVVPGSPAAIAGIKAGDEVISVDAKQTPSWQSVNMALISSLGESKTITLNIKAGEPGKKPTGAVESKKVSVTNWLVDGEQPNPISALGLIPFSLKVPAVIGKVIQGGAAQKAGLIRGDKIIAMDGVVVNDWLQWVKLIRQYPHKRIKVQLLRNDKPMFVELTPEAKDSNGQHIGYIGAAVQPVSWPKELIRTQQFGPVIALVKGVKTTWSLTMMTFESIWKMIIGLVSVKNLSGPITIAKVATASLQAGFENFLYFLGMLSVSLGVLNLLPIPVLDGGHLLFYLVEWVKGKPLSETIQLAGLRIGVALVMFVMILALYNDVSRLF